MFKGIRCIYKLMKLGSWTKLGMNGFISKVINSDDAELIEIAMDISDTSCMGQGPDIWERMILNTYGISGWQYVHSCIKEKYNEILLNEFITEIEGL